jgi:hypothetical protein
MRNLLYSLSCCKSSWIMGQVFSANIGNGSVMRGGTGMRFDQMKRILGQGGRISAAASSGETGVLLVGSLELFSANVAFLADLSPPSPSTRPSFLIPSSSSFAHSTLRPPRYHFIIGILPARTDHTISLPGIWETFNPLASPEWPFRLLQTRIGQDQGLNYLFQDKYV